MDIDQEISDDVGAKRLGYAIMGVFGGRGSNQGDADALGALLIERGVKDPKTAVEYLTGAQRNLSDGMKRIDRLRAFRHYLAGVSKFMPKE